MILNILHYVGSSMLLVVIAYILVELIHSKKVNKTAIAGRVFILVVLFIALLRTK